MRQDVLAQKRAQQEAADKQKQAQREQQQMQKLRAGIATDGFLPYKELLDQDRRQMLSATREIYQNPVLSWADKQMQTEQRVTDYNSQVDWTKQVEKRFKDIVRLSSGADAPYNTAAVDAALYASLKDKDGQLLKPGTYSPDALNKVLDNPDTFDKNAVATRFLDELAKADTSTTSTAATPGRYGQRNTAESNLWEVENGVLKLDPATGRRIARTNRPEVVEAARRDPFVSKIIDQQMQAQAAAVAGVVEKMKALEPLTAEEQQLVAQEQNGPKSYAQYLNELLLPHAYQRTSEIQTYARPIAPKTPKVAPKKPATEITVTPTVGYQASSYTPEATGVGQRMKSALGITPARVTNHYPTVGVTFASARSPYAEVMVDNRGAQVVGQDGTTTTVAQGNGKVPMRVTSRDLALYINGKRVGRKEEFNSDTDAYAYLLSTIERLTPEQARKAELRAEYRGSITDKARMVNDGTGGQQQAPNNKLQGVSLPFPTDSKRQAAGPTATEQSVIIQANQVTDAQLQQASGGTWNPRKLTAEQGRAVEALRRKGGRLVSPYEGGATSSNNYQQGSNRGGSVYKVGTVGSNDVLGFGEPVKLAGTKKSGVDWSTPTSPSSRGGAY